MMLFRLMVFNIHRIHDYLYGLYLPVIKCIICHGLLPRMFHHFLQQTLKNVFEF